MQVFDLDAMEGYLHPVAEKDLHQVAGCAGYGGQLQAQGKIITLTLVMVILTLGLLGSRFPNLERYHHLYVSRTSPLDPSRPKSPLPSSRHWY